MVGPEFSEYQVMNGRNRFVPVVVEIVALWSIVHETNRRHIAPLQNKGRYVRTSPHIGQQLLDC